MSATDTSLLFWKRLAINNNIINQHPKNHISINKYYYLNNIKFFKNENVYYSHNNYSVCKLKSKISSVARNCLLPMWMCAVDRIATNILNGSVCFFFCWLPLFSHTFSLYYYYSDCYRCIHVCIIEHIQHNYHCQRRGEINTNNQCLFATLLKLLLLLFFFFFFI